MSPNSRSLRTDAASGTLLIKLAMLASQESRLQLGGVKQALLAARGTWTHDALAVEVLHPQDSKGSPAALPSVRHWIGQV